jgi:uncharacterized C2H2 Zn-finger protein
MKKLFKCPICDSRFGQNAQLERHVSNVHEGKKQFMCLICQSNFSEKGSLKKHTRKFHTDPDQL